MTVFSDQAPTAATNGRTHGHTPPHVPRLARLGDLVDEIERDAREAHDAYLSGRPRGPLTGLQSLDRELGGCLMAGSHVVTGAPGAGKTAFALHVARTCRFPALVVSLEMGALELVRRIVAAESGLHLGRLKSGELDPAEVVENVRRAAAKVPDLVLADATQCFPTPDWIRSTAELLRERARASRVLVVIDSAHSWANRMPDQATEYERLAEALGVLGALARQLDSPFLVIAERNRASMKTGGLNASAGHRGFEYGAETMLELGTEEGAAFDVMGEKPVTLKISKNRHGGDGGKVALKFHGGYQRFREV